MKKIVYFAMLFVSVLILASCKTTTTTVETSGTTERTQTGFSIDSSSVKVNYHFGEELALDGLVVKVSYSDGTETTITQGYTTDTSQYNKEAAGTYVISVTYASFPAKTFQVTVGEPGVTDLIIDTTNVKKVYKTGEDLSLDGLVVKQLYQDDSEVVVDNYVVNSSTYNKDVVGTYDITITLGDLTKTFSVSVVAPEVTGISINTDAVKKEYFIGQDLLLDGLVVKLVYDNQTETVLETGYDVDMSEFNKDIAGTYTIDIIYGDFTEQSFTVTVRAAEVTGIRIDSSLVKAEYLLNETFIVDGLVVKHVYEDGREEVITDFEIDSTGFNNLEAGTNTIIVKKGTYETKTFTVNVLNKMNISTPQDLELMISLGGANEYTLLNDIDMTGVTTLTGGSKSFSGILDGKGFTISGLDVTASGNKMGIFFKEALDGAVIKNLNFEESIYRGGGTGEASAFIVAYAHGGSTFDNITFTNVTVAHGGSYAALVFGDTKAASDKPIVLTRITVNNDEVHEIRGLSYIGGLVGRVNHALTVDLSYIHFTSQVRAGSYTGDEFIPNQACGVLIGRLNAADITINVNNTVINGSATGSKNVGSVIGTSLASTTLNTNNVLINYFDGYSGTNKVDVLVGNPNGMAINETNTFYVEENLHLYETADLTPHTPTEGVAVALADLTMNWFTTSGLDNQYFALFGKLVVLKNNQNHMYLTTPDDVIAMISQGGDTNYTLANDIDMTGVTTLTGGSNSFSGIFDGAGYTISGLDVTASGNKMGIFFKEALEGAVIKNINFEESIYHGGGTGEASAFIVAYAHGGSTFDNITFTNVTVAHGGSYAALVFGDTKAASDQPIVISRITVNNDEVNEVRGLSYIGGLVGRLNHPLTLDLSYIHFNSQVRAGTITGDVFTPNQAAGLLVGRLTQAGTVINLDNVVISGSATGSKNVGAVLGTSIAGTTLNSNHVFINSFDGYSGTNKVDVLVGNPNGMTINETNTFYVEENLHLYETTDLTPHTPTQGVSIASLDVTTDWFTTSGFDQTYWLLNNGQVVKNGENTGGVKSPTGFLIVTSEVDKLYMVGEQLDLTGLVVKVKYSDGTREELTADEYQVTHHFDPSTPNTYTITISYLDYDVQTFEVKVVSVIGFNVYSDDVKKTYLVGEPLTLSNLVVKAVLSDQSEITLGGSEYTIDSSSYDANVANEYTITISFEDFAVQNIIVTVIQEALTVIDSAATVSVDASYMGVDGAVMNNMNQFKTMKAALDYLTAHNLDSTVEKRIYIANGTYFEKLIITMPNLTLIGESSENTILTYNVRSGDLKLDGTTWGTQGSASITIKSSATNFQAKNLTFENSFDYFGSVAQGISSDVQAVALVTEADMVSFYNVRFLGSQDTLYAKSGRQYYYNCYIEGVVDFIFGNAGPAFFENTTVYSQNRSSGVITAQKGAESTGTVTYGYVFYNSTLLAEEGTPANSVHLGRPWGAAAAVAYINTTMGDHISSIGWTDMSGNLPENANFFEFGSVDANGNPIVRDESIYKGTILTFDAAQAYANKDNVFATTNGTLTFEAAWDYATDMTNLTNLTYLG